MDGNLGNWGAGFKGNFAVSMQGAIDPARLGATIAPPFLIRILFRIYVIAPISSSV